VDNKVSVQDIRWSYVETAKGTDSARMWSKEYNDNVGKHKQRPCTLTDIVSTKFSAKQSSAVSSILEN
jgi:hypothetical protein